MVINQKLKTTFYYVGGKEKCWFLSVLEVKNKEYVEVKHYLTIVKLDKTSSKLVVGTTANM